MKLDDVDQGHAITSQADEGPGSPDQGKDRQVASPKTENAVIVRELHKKFGKQDAVKGVSLTIPRGTIYGLLGPNGAGKTTTIRMILGIVEPDSGERWILGEQNPARVARKLGYLPEERGLYATMKAKDVIAYMGALRGLSHAEARKRGIEMLAEYGLDQAASKRIRQLSKGMAQTVQIIGTLVHEPELVVLDEPFSGLDALNQEKLENLIRSIAARGATVIFSTHVIAHAERLCDKVGIIAGGKIRFNGTVSQARETMERQVIIETRHNTEMIRSIFPDNVGYSRNERGFHVWTFPIENGDETSIERMLEMLVSERAAVISVNIEKARLHDAFMQIARSAAKNPDKMTD